MLFLTACASTGVEKTSGTVGYSPEYTRALGTGKTIDEAKTNAFNVAIEIVVGSVVITERQSNNNQLIRDEIIRASSKFVFLTLADLYLQLQIYSHQLRYSILLLNRKRHPKFTYKNIL